MGSAKVIVFCRDCFSAEFVAEELSTDGRDCVLVHDKLGQLARPRSEARWRSGEASILITTDLVDPVNSSGTCSHIVHFELPAASKTAFELRYSHLLHGFASIYGPGESKSRVSSTLILTPEDGKALDYIHQFLVQSFGRRSLPEEVTELIWRHKLKMAEGKVAADLCDGIKRVGKCQV